MSLAKKIAVFAVTTAIVTVLAISASASDPTLIGDVVTASMFEGILTQVFSILPSILPVVVAIIGIKVGIGFIRNLLH